MRRLKQQLARWLAPAEPAVRPFTDEEAALLHAVLARRGLDADALVDRALADAMSEGDVVAVHDALSAELIESGGVDHGHVTPYGEQLERLADLIADRERPPP